MLPPIALTAGLAIDWTSDYWGRRFLSLFNPERDSSFQVRNAIINQYLDDALNRPFGNGTATTSYADFAVEALREANQRGEILSSGIFIPTDNNYFLALLEGGVVGLILLLLVVFGVMLYALRASFALKDRTLRSLAVGLCGCVGSASLASLSNNYLQFWGTWLLIGLVICLNHVVDEERRAERFVQLEIEPAEHSEGRAYAPG